MIDYDEAKKLGFEWLKTVESVTELSSAEKKAYGVLSQFDGWSIRTELRGRESEVVEICIHVLLMPDYPLSFPKFFMSPESYNFIKYIPHVNNERSVCIFNNNAKPDPNYPLEVLKESIYRAKRIIENGIKGEENKSAFEEEFQAYWEDKYDNESDTDKSVILMFNEHLTESEISVLCIDDLNNGIRYVVHKQEDFAVQFKLYLERYRYQFNEIKGFFLGELSDVNKPPFSLTNREAFKLLSNLSKDTRKAFKRFINDPIYPKLVLFSKVIDEEVKYFGWFHKPVDTNKKGFRPGSLSIYQAMSTFSGNINVKRFLPEFLTQNRLSKRSTGIYSDNRRQIYSIVGVGSVGSNLISFLNAKKSDEFRFIDFDTLKIENIGRHLLGFRYLNMNKSLALQDYLQHFSPTQKISIKQTSVVALVNSTPEYLNESDYVFVALGEENIENWLVSQISSGVLTQPFFFLWVEPYLLGGHCVYIHPNDNIYTDYFDVNKHFEYNIIAKSEYVNQNPVLSLKEAGCQTNYTPYSANDVMSFLGQLNSYILQIMKNRETKSRSFTWVGDKNLAKNINLELSDYSNTLNSFTITENSRP